MVYSDEMKEYIKNMIDDAQPGQVVIRPTEILKVNNKKVYLVLKMRNQKKTKMNMRI